MLLLWSYSHSSFSLSLCNSRVFLTAQLSLHSKVFRISVCLMFFILAALKANIPQYNHLLSVAFNIASISYLLLSNYCVVIAFIALKSSLLPYRVVITIISLTLSQHSLTRRRQFIASSLHSSRSHPRFRRCQFIAS